MDVGEVGSGDWGEQEGDGEEEWPVDWVGPDTQCHRCGGFGHLARDCATTKGKGKDSKGTGKGSSLGKGGTFGAGPGAKGGGKGYKGYKGGKGWYSKGAGKGKGYQGTCWRCGEIGHKAAECTKAQVSEVTEEATVNQVDMSGVWLIGAVEAKTVPVPAGSPKEKIRFIQCAEGCKRGDCARLMNNSEANTLNIAKTLNVVEPRRGLRPMHRDRVGTKSIEDHWSEPRKGLSLDHRARIVEVCNPFEGLEVTDHEEASCIESPAGLGGSDDDGPTFQVQRRRCRTAGGGKERPTIGSREVPIGTVVAEGWSRMGGMVFHVADVKKPLAAAAKVVEAGNRVVFDPNPGASFIENIATGERIALRKERGVYVLDVKYAAGGEGTITRDSGAGVSVWPADLLPGVAMMPKEEGLRMVAANGTLIPNIGRKLVKFQGRQGFARQP